MKLAAMVGDQAFYNKYRSLAQSYKELWNPGQKDDQGNVRGFFTPNAGTVDKVSNVNQYAYQGNLWTYRWTVPHDIQGLAKLRGGNEALVNDLKYFFDDVNEYVAINEPDVHAPYLFNYLGKPYLTQYYAREYTTEEVVQKYHNHGLYTYPMVSRVYRADPEGYLQSMDDDAGAMSSWFVYSAMGLFPGNPGDPYYLIGSPIFDEMTLHLDNGKDFTVKANNVSSDNRYIQSGQLNGANFEKTWISYADIMAGGTLEFEMASTPNTAWAASADAAPPATDYAAEADNLLQRHDLIAENSTWKYNDQGKAAGTGWKDQAFDDSGWLEGPAMLGYSTSNNGLNTVVGYGPDANNKYPATYFRKTVEVSNPGAVSALEAGLIRDDGAAVYLNGHEIIRTNLPAGQIAYDTYANATVNNERDFNSYIIDPSYLVEGTNVLTAEVHQVNGSSSDIAFDFKLTAIEQLKAPDAPTNPLADDEANTFGWTAVPGFAALEEYEYSIDGGLTWKGVRSNPQSVGSGRYETGKVQVRIKANAGLKRAAGAALLSDKPYTSDNVWSVYDLEVELKREGQLSAEVKGTLTGEYEQMPVVVYQLLKGEQLLSTTAVPVKQGDFQMTQMFNVSGSQYQVHVYLVDKFSGNLEESRWLAESVPYRPAPEPQPGKPEPENPEPENPEPENPEPENPEPENPGPENPEPENPQPGDRLKVEFESRGNWSPEVNSFNRNPLKTEGGNGGTVVANTFDGAWLTYDEVDFGTEGKNYIEVTYDAPVPKAPADVTLEIRLDSEGGKTIGTIALPNTGSGWGTYKTAGAFLSENVTGIQDLYLVMKGSSDSGHPYMGNFDSFSFRNEPVRTDFAALELENYDDWSTELNPANQNPLKTEAGRSGKQIANTFNGAWVRYQNMDFGSEGANQLAIDYVGNSTNSAADAVVEVRLGSVSGEKVGSVAVPPTGSNWSSYQNASAALKRTVTGIQDVYLVFTGTTDSTYKYIGNFDAASFSLSAPEPDVTVQMENKTSWSSAVNSFNGKPLKSEGGNGGTVVANTFNGAWLTYSEVDFGTQGKNYVEVLYDAPTTRTPADLTAEIRLNDKDGTLLGTVALVNTGSGWGNYKAVGVALTQQLSGKQTICVVLKGTTTSSQLYAGNLDSLKFSKISGK
ncbi:glycoside hydrolase family 92 protein [Paenibacillus albidus]|uniref:glycoside hydrolase domain-containing protein n=1 Tax=Paenibacillus albidus TaxID=2041023 RepID=UPI001BEC0730|nr:glycoside hydrolase domain-containing protein [Paenibacillus albidus]MBT2293574.1 glycoside hydrolase family 92 protein [Paenibacillus albidus]